MWVSHPLGETADESGGREGIWPPHQIFAPINANVIRFNVLHRNAMQYSTLLHLHCSTKDATGRMCLQSSIQNQMWLKAQHHDSLYIIALQCNDIHIAMHWHDEEGVVYRLCDRCAPSPLSHLWANLWQNLPIDPIATRQDPFSFQPWIIFSHFLS